MDGYSHRYPFKYERVSLPVNARLSFAATNNLTALRMDCRLDVQVGEIPTSFTNVTFNCFCKNSVFSRPKFCLPAASSERPFQRPCGLRKSRQIPVTYVTSCHIVGIQPVLINRDANYNLTESATRSADLNIPEFYDTKSNYQLIVSITKCEDVQYTLIPSFFPLLKTSRTYFIQVQIGQL